MKVMRSLRRFLMLKILFFVYGDDSGDGDDDDDGDAVVLGYDSHGDINGGADDNGDVVVLGCYSHIDDIGGDDNDDDGGADGFWF